MIPEDTDRLCSLLRFQHGILHYDGLFHQVGRKLPVTVNGCAHYRCVNNWAIWQSAEEEKMQNDLKVKMQSTDLVGSVNNRFPVTSTQKVKQMHNELSTQLCFQKLLALLMWLRSHSVPEEDKRQQDGDNCSTDDIWSPQKQLRLPRTLRASGTRGLHNSQTGLKFTSSSFGQDHSFQAGGVPGIGI